MVPGPVIVLPEEEVHPGGLYEVIIVGAGPAGLTAALYAARGGASVLVIERGLPCGLVATTNRVENCPGWVEGSGAELGQYLLKQALAFGAKFFQGEVTRVDLSASPKQVWVGDVRLSSPPVPGRGGSTFRGKGSAGVGASPSVPPVTGLSLRTSKLRSSAGAVRRCRSPVASLTIIQDLGYLTAEKVLQDRVLGNPKVRVWYNRLVKQILCDGRVRGVVVEDRLTGAVETVEVEGIFIFIGLEPNSELVRGQLKLDERGYVITNEHMETDIPGVFAAGDVRRGQPARSSRPRPTGPLRSYRPRNTFGKTSPARDYG